MRVFVLLFNARTENEGIHTLKLGDRNTILMFASEDDATRYGLMLEAQDFASPAIEEFDAEEIEEFCRGAGYGCKLVPEGTLELPPEANVEKTDLDLAKEQSTPATAKKSELSQTELEEMRRRLEGLL